MANREARATHPERPPVARQPAFEGFAPLQSDTTYCPNQFFDVVLRHFPRGVVRLVGYALYRTFAWSNRDGRPMNERHPVSYQELIESTGSKLPHLPPSTTFLLCTTCSASCIQGVDGVRARFNCDVPARGRLR